jgi:hypothetical protein
MKLKNLLLALSAFAAAPVFAQAIGTVTTVNGVATVTTGTTGTAIVTGAPIMHGSRVITTSSGSVTLRLNNGCTVTVPPGHGVTVLSNLTCEQLRAAIQPVTTTVTTTTTTSQVPVGIGPFSGGTALGAAAILLGAGLAIANDDDDEAPLSGR